MGVVSAAEAAVRVLESEGAEVLFGIPGASILPFYAALKGSRLRHVLARHEEGATHAAEGFTRARAGAIGIAVGTSGPAGTNMVTGLYSALADSIPILCITGQAPRDELEREYFQAVDVAAITRPVTKWSVCVKEPGQVPGVFRKAYQIMREGRPGPVHIDLPIDVQKAPIAYDPARDRPLPVVRPEPDPGAIEAALDLLQAAERPLVIAGGGVILAEASQLLVRFAEITQTPVVPTLMGWGAIPDDHPLQAGQVGLQTQHRYGNATFLEADFVLGIGNRWANRHTGSLEVYRRGKRFVHIDIEPTQIGRIFPPDLGIVADARLALEALVEAAEERARRGLLPDRSAWVRACQERKRRLRRRDDFDQVPIKPQRVFREMRRSFPRETRYVTAIGLYQIAACQFLEMSWPRQFLICGQAGPLGWEIPAAVGAKLADPEREVVAIVGDYSFQFLVEELAMAAQYRVPFVVVVVNNAYLGLIRQAEMAYDMDYEVQLGFVNANAPEIGDFGVDHLRAAEAFGAVARRVVEPRELAPAFAWAREEARRRELPVVVEVMTEKVTNIAMGPEIDRIREFEPVVDEAEPVA